MQTILIIDDRVAERRLLYHALKGAYRVLEAEDRVSALRHLDTAEVDLILLDMHLPPRCESPAEGMRIHEILRERRPDLPVVIATSDDDGELIRRMRASGVADYLIKPVPPRRLLGAIAQVLESPSS